MVDAGRATLSDSFRKSPVRASVPARQHQPETVNFRVAGVFAWQIAWHHRDQDNPFRAPSFTPFVAATPTLDIVAAKEGEKEAPGQDFVETATSRYSDPTSQGDTLIFSLDRLNEFTKLFETSSI